ncbi:hypothetical protein ACFFRR_004140 [Megaselia abdita]
MWKRYLWISLFGSNILLANSAPDIALRTYDIWDSVDDDGDLVDLVEEPERQQHVEIVNRKRNERVLHLFPVPVDGECLSTDGRRIGACFNAYECRNKGGKASGDCAMGFGVCCIFVADCDQTITNNITYLVSPNFPSAMANDNITSCGVHVQIMNEEISQLRIDFYHFSLGQPNRTTGVCDGDFFQISATNLSNPVIVCGQNSGQHIYYDVGRSSQSNPRPMNGNFSFSEEPMEPRQSFSTSPEIISLSLNFSDRYLPNRLWEMRISQIPFSQKAPLDCRQYYTGMEGVVQTFNFADNGRHLANQNYRICIRQETGMCSIVYQPCDERSFAIGRTRRRTMTTTTSVAPQSAATLAVTTTTNAPTTAIPDSTTVRAVTTTAAPADLVEGSGDGTPTREEPDFMALFRNTIFDFRSTKRRNAKNLYTTCNDRITMPCIIEDFIAPGKGWYSFYTFLRFDHFSKYFLSLNFLFVFFQDHCPDVNLFIVAGAFVLQE